MTMGPVGYGVCMVPLFFSSINIRKGTSHRPERQRRSIPHTVCDAQATRLIAQNEIQTQAPDPLVHGI